MNIKLLQDMELEIFQSSRQRKPTIEKFEKGTEFEIDICNDEKTEIQFGDGDVCFVTPEFWKDVEILKED